jgi:hypothetical protein
LTPARRGTRFAQVDGHERIVPERGRRAQGIRQAAPDAGIVLMSGEFEARDVGVGCSVAL